MSQIQSRLKKQFQPTKLPKLRLKLKYFFIPISLSTVIVGVLIWSFASPSKTQQLQISGRIEGYETDIGAKTSGRVDYVSVREGEQVHKGELIARLNDDDIQAQLRGATAQVAAAQQQEIQEHIGIDVAETQLREGQLNYSQAQVQARGTIAQAQAQVAQSEAQLAQDRAQVKQAEADLKLAEVNRNRYFKLAEEGAETQLMADRAENTYRSNLAILNARQAAVNAATKQVSAAKGSLVQAQSTGLNPGIRNTQIETLQKRMSQSRALLKAAEARFANAVAARQQIVAQIAYLNIVSPIDGIVTARSVEPGAVVTSGKTLLTILNPNTVFLRAYVPEGDIGRVRVGQRAIVSLDSAPNRPFTARVSEIDAQASFTPENIYFKSERVKQVFGIKIAIDNPVGFAKPGMPADAVISDGYSVSNAFYPTFQTSYLSFRQVITCLFEQVYNSVGIGRKASVIPYILRPSKRFIE